MPMIAFILLSLIILLALFSFAVFCLQENGPVAERSIPMIFAMFVAVCLWLFGNWQSGIPWEITRTEQAQVQLASSGFQYIQINLPNTIDTLNVTEKFRKVFPEGAKVTVKYRNLKRLYGGMDYTGYPAYEIVEK